MFNDVQAGQTGEIARHNRYGRLFNQRVSVWQFDSIEAALAAQVPLHFPPGNYDAGELVVNHALDITADYGARLDCISLMCAPVSGYQRVKIGELQIVATGEYALKLDRCRADLNRTSLNSGGVAALFITGGISSRYQGVYCGSSAIGMYMGGDETTTQTFADCTFNASTIGIKIESASRGIKFTDESVFQTCEVGGVVDGVAGVITFDTCWFENPAKELLIVGSTAEVKSIKITHPIVFGGNANDNTTDAFIFDNVGRVTWDAGGAMFIDKASWIKTTAQTQAGVISEPFHYGLPHVFGDSGRMFVEWNTGQVGLNRLSLGGVSELGSKYFLEADDSYWAQGDMFAVYVPTTADYVKLAQTKADANSGVKVTPTGVVVRAPNGSEWLLKVSNAGVLSTEAL